MSESSFSSAHGGRAKIILPVLILLGILLFVITYLGIQKSRSDSLELIKQQGEALIESLTLSSDNAIKANSLFDLLVQEKFSDLAGFIEFDNLPKYTSSQLADMASEYGVDAIFIFNRQSNIEVSGARGLFVDLELLIDLITPQVDSFLQDSSSRDAFQLISGRSPSEMSMFYLKRAEDNNHVIAIVSDALFYSSAKKDIGIGYLVQNIAREVGIEYILFQTHEGIVFSSRKVGPVAKIEDDTFLVTALISDTISSRIYTFDDRRILELVKPFSSVEYQSGLFRLGLSLEKYYDIMAGFDIQMIVLSVVIFAVILLAMLYLAGKQKRIYLDRSFKQMKSLSDKVFESINSGILVVGKDGTIEMANRQLLSIFEIEETALLRKKWAEFPFRDVLPFEKILLGQATPGDVESILNLSSGRKNLIVNISRLNDPDNREAGAVAVVYDYTAIKELEDNARRKERLTELGDLAAGVAHEIRNPLNAISIAAQRLLAEFEPKENLEEFQSFTRQIRAESNRLNDIVTRFLSMTKARSEKKDRVNFSQLVIETLELIRLDVAQKNVSLNLKVEPNLLISGSADRLKQLVINLVRNGVEACYAGGGKVEVNLRRQNGQIVFIVSDTGLGIPDELKKKIFTPYFTTKEKGTGLGLSIVHQIVDEHGGDIEVISPSTGGAQFRVVFPS